MARTFQQEYLDMPLVTRVYITACVLTTSAVNLDIVTPYQLYFNRDLITAHYQLWRIFTTFLFLGNFGTIGFSFLFNIIFTYRYCRMLEDGSFRGRSADFFYMFLFCGTLMIIIAMFLNFAFLGQAFAMMLAYIWSRRNPYVWMNIFGFISFRAPYLPWVLLTLSLIFGHSTEVDFMGIAVGHIYYFLEDVFPYQVGGMRLLRTPRIIKYIFESELDDEPD